jgi:branched-subunit amino acid transport protein AzlD
VTTTALPLSAGLITILFLYCILKIKRALEAMHARGHIDDKTVEYFTPEDSKPCRFYLLPKIHKENNHGRRIVSANGQPTDDVLSVTTTALPLSAGLITILFLYCIFLRADLSACVK